MRERQVERKAERVLEKNMEAAGFNLDSFDFQGSEDEEIQALLPAKKSGLVGKGKPEHIFKLNGDAADLIITECKACPSQHSSKQNLEPQNKLRAVEFAEDGVIHYMKGLSKEFNVIGIAASGTSEQVITTFLCMRNGHVKRLPQTSILSPDDYRRILKNEDGYGHRTEEEILDVAQKLHTFLRDEMELSEPKKPIIVSAILLALMVDSFRQGYRSEKDDQGLADLLYNAIVSRLKGEKIDEEKREIMLAEFAFIKTQKAVKKHLRKTIKIIYKGIFHALTNQHSSVDVVGSFYGEFLRYSGGDKKGLGIVLTPRHVADLFAEIANLDPRKSVVLDICAGTGGFLISAMVLMLLRANGDSELETDIRRNRLIGIEHDPGMYTLGCSNMIFRRDGKSNFYNQDALELDVDVLASIRDRKPNVAFLNPPYSKTDKKKHELAFVEKALDLLEDKGICAAIIPVGAVNSEAKHVVELKRRILSKHTLVASMSMPEKLFGKVGAVAVIVVFEAHRPHFSVNSKGKMSNEALNPTWFGYWRDDGFIISKNRRREATKGSWEKTKREWLSAYNQRSVKSGESALVKVIHTDEWVVEAYIETDYSKLTENDFSRAIKQYLLYELMLDVNACEEDEDEDNGET